MTEKIVPMRNKNAKANLPSYQMYANIYKGGRFVKYPTDDTLDPWKRGGQRLSNGSYIHAFANESPEAFTVRVHRSVYRNFSSDVVRVNLATIFEQGNSIDRREVEEDLGEDVSKNIDNHGSNLGSFIRRVARETFIYGWSGVFTDYDNDGKPFSKIILPVDVYDWQIDKDTGQFFYLLVSEGYYDGKKYFREIDAESWRVINDGGEVIQEGIHDYDGDLPFDVFICDDPSSDDDEEPFGHSVNSDTADLQIENYNLSSQLEDLTAKVNFPILHIKQAPSTAKAGSKTPLAIGPDYGLFSAADIKWISPDISAIDRTRELLDANTREIREVAGIATRSEESTEAHSGAALRWEYSTKLSLIKLRAENIRDGEMRLYKRYEKLLNQDVRYYSIKYPSDYATSPVPEELNNLQVMKGLQVPDDILIAQLKSIVMKTFYHKSNLSDLLLSCDNWFDNEQIEEKETQTIEKEEEEDEQTEN